MSPSFQLKDGDTLTFGVDFQGSQIRDHKSVTVTVNILPPGSKVGSIGGAPLLNNLTQTGMPVTR